MNQSPFVRLIQNTTQDFLELRQVLGLSPTHRVGFERCPSTLTYLPVLEHAGRTYRVGDEMPTA